MFTLFRQLFIATCLPVVAILLVGYLPAREEARVPMKYTPNTRLLPLTKPLRAKAAKPRAKLKAQKPKRFDLSSACRDDDPTCVLTVKEPSDALHTL